MLREKPISRYLENVLKALPSAFAQLVFFIAAGSLHGRYLHEGWASVSTPEEVNLALRETHRSIFEAVVNLPLTDLSGECGSTLIHWDRSKCGQPTCGWRRSLITK